MREKIKAFAALNKRSMNAEIVAVLEEHYGEVDDIAAALLNYSTDLLSERDIHLMKDQIMKDMDRLLDGKPLWRGSEKAQAKLNFE